jgi:hypothetical protein
MERHSFSGHVGMFNITNLKFEILASTMKYNLSWTPSIVKKDITASFLKQE